MAALSGTHEYRGVARSVGEAPEGIRFYEQVSGRAAAYLAALPAPHPLEAGPRLRRVRSRMPEVREAGTEAGEPRGGEGRLLRGRRLTYATGCSRRHGIGPIRNFGEAPSTHSGA
jgi:hypothetical protein